MLSHNEPAGAPAVSCRYTTKRRSRISAIFQPTRRVGCRHYADIEMATPVLVAVEDVRSDHVVERELRKRYEPDYEVISAGSAQAGLGTLTKLAEAGRQVVVILADLHLPEITGSEFLTRARQLHPAARRCLLISSEDQSSGVRSYLEEMRRVARLGQVDDYLVKPIQHRNEQFHRAITEHLDDWGLTNKGGFEAVKVVGEELTPRSHELCDALTRNAIPFGFYAAGSPGGRALLEQAAATSATLPVVLVFEGQVLENPTTSTIAEALGVTTRPTAAHYDLAVVGAGPAGLAAAVSGASEGLATALLEPEAFGGQASASPRIRNYLGFSHGVTGANLTRRAVAQASQFGVDLIYGSRAVGLRSRHGEQVVTLSDGGELRGGAVIIATGCSYRRLGIPALEALIGAGVFYGPAVWEAQAMKGRDVFVVGGANSAGQTAVHLASCGAHVTILSRGSSFAQTMSAYLIKEIQSTPAITVRHNVEIVDGGGRGCMESLTLKDGRSDRQEAVPAQALFVLIGAEPHTDWLPAEIERDRWGFVMTDADLSPANWPLGRQPLLFETSLPRVFAVGDVRHGSAKRIAAAVGEGSTVIRLIHECLAAG